MKKSDISHLEWITNRIVEVYGEDENTDFVLKMREIISSEKDRLCEVSQIKSEDIEEFEDIEEKRHFIIYFRVMNGGGKGYAFGNCVVSQEGYPNRDHIQREMVKDTRYKSCDILGVTEVSKQDADNFSL